MSESYTVSVSEISKRLNKDIEKITTEEIARLYYPYSDNVIIKCHDINGTPMHRGRYTAHWLRCSCILRRDVTSSTH